MLDELGVYADGVSSVELVMSCHLVVMVCPIDSIFVLVLPKNVIYWKMNMDNLQGFDA